MFYFLGLYFLAALFGIDTAESLNWVQFGQDIIGEAYDDRVGYSVSLSSDGTVLAIGAPFNDGNGTDSGHVRVYKWRKVTGRWNQLGADIDGENSNDQSGWSVSLSSGGTVLAIRARNNSGKRVYKWNGKNKWYQLGQDIDGGALEYSSGRSLSISSDGTVLAIGAPYKNATGAYQGHVRVFKWNGSNKWSQLGVDIEDPHDETESSVSLSSDGTVLAIGNVGDGIDSGHVRVYKWNGTDKWSQLGADINGEADYDWFGYSVSLSSDGTLLAIGAPYNNNNHGQDAGHVRVYKWSKVTGKWSQLGADIDGEAANDQSGLSVSLSSGGTVLAVGAPYHSDYAGHVRVYKWWKATRNWRKLGADINGAHAAEYFGWSLSLSSNGTVLAVGATGGDGMVRVYRSIG